MVYICKMIISAVVFLFFQNLIFQVVSVAKGQNIAQNDKKFCLLHSISQELYIIGSSFMVHMCKTIISSGVFLFSFFQNFGFPGCQGGVKGQKMAQDDKKFCLSHLINSKNSVIFSKKPKTFLRNNFFKI